MAETIVAFEVDFERLVEFALMLPTPDFFQSTEPKEYRFPGPS
ncbi:hypothetical protein CBA19CS11_28225 [Caballeronia novacaledonica]|nr:hypothetical protein [Caballeronia novacaledonica]GJH12805.1 hypothetical protein CBA19CS11_28225 [Caballeronia novacaledonica]